MIQSASTSTNLTSVRSIFKSLLYLAIGLIIGIEFTLVVFNQTDQCHRIITIQETPPKVNNEGSPISDPAVFQQNIWKNDANEQNSDDNIIEYLFNTTRVLCWIMTQPDYHQSRAIHIRNTWGRRCNTLLFMSSQSDETLPSIALPVEEGPDHLWNKTRLALKYIYDYHLNDADWFLKADDDTYVVMENLRMFLHGYSADDPLYFGCKVKRPEEPEFMSGGAGYVLSKHALVKFANEAYNNSELCDQLETDENMGLSKCLRNIDVIAGDSRDDELKERFIPLAPIHVIPDFKMEWYDSDIYHSANETVSCCSPYAVSFHYTDWREFYTLDYLLYSLRPFGVYSNVSWKLPDSWEINNEVI